MCKNHLHNKIKVYKQLPAVLHSTIKLKEYETIQAEKQLTKVTRLPPVPLTFMGNIHPRISVIYMPNPACLCKIPINKSIHNSVNDIPLTLYRKVILPCLMSKSHN